jgi:hypothetical protein
VEKVMSRPEVARVIAEFDSRFDQALPTPLARNGEHGEVS